MPTLFMPRPTSSALRWASGALFFLLLGGGKVGLSGQEAPERTSDAVFLDQDAEALFERALRRRLTEASEIESFQGWMWERIEVRLNALGLRRERALFRSERTAWIRWTAEGERQIRWEGVRQEVPIASDGPIAVSVQRDLERGRLPPPLTFDPASDRLFFGSNEWALNPLVDTATVHYRYASGDTLRIQLPDGGEPIVLAELRVIPRRNEFRLISASLWFDLASGSLVRSIYTPARPFDLLVDGGPDASASRLIRPILAEIRVVSVEHGLYEGNLWIPRSYLFEGEVSAARAIRLPIRVEWQLTEMQANGPEGGLFTLPDTLEGWRETVRTVAQPGGSEGDSVRVRTLVPPPGTLLTGKGLSDPARPGSDRIRVPSDLRAIQSQLRRNLPRAGWSLTPLYGLDPGITRFNRVEGLASGVGVRGSMPWLGEGEVLLRLGTEEIRPTAELSLRPGLGPLSGVELRGYRRLVASSGLREGWSGSSSLSNLVWGEGPTPYHRSLGLSLGGSANSWEGELFTERQTSAALGTPWHIWRLADGDRSLPEVAPSTEGHWSGFRGGVRFQTAGDPGGWLLSGRGALEGAVGGSEYLRALGSLGLLVPLPGPLDGALELTSGGSAGQLPLQRRFFPGGGKGFRPVQVGELSGSSLHLLRGEVGWGGSGARLVAFHDLLLLDSGPWERGSGGGVSFLDGLLRAEVSQRRPSGEETRSWRLLFYVDAQF